MRIYDRERNLPLRHSGYEFQCPGCRFSYANEGYDGRKVVCPNCRLEWRVQINGHPKTVLSLSQDVNFSSSQLPT